MHNFRTMISKLKMKTVTTAKIYILFYCLRHVLNEMLWRIWLPQNKRRFYVGVEESLWFDDYWSYDHEKIERRVLQYFSGQKKFQVKKKSKMKKKDWTKTFFFGVFLHFRHYDGQKVIHWRMIGFCKTYTPNGITKNMNIQHVVDQIQLKSHKRFSNFCAFLEIVRKLLKKTFVSKNWKNMV